MPNIELDCPNCQEPLVLDSAFAGSVCRCAACGTMMTVPDKTAAESPPVARPSAPGETPTNEGVVAEVDYEDDIPEVIPDVPVTPSQPAPATAYRKPVARRQPKKAGLGLKLAFAGLLALVVGGGGVFIMFLVLGGPAGPVDDPAKKGVGFDSANNPFTSDAPSFLTVPLAKRVVILVDAYSDFDGRDDSVVRTVDSLGTSNEVQFVYYTDIGPESFPEAPRWLKAEDKPALKSFVSGISSPNVSEAGEGLDEALKAKPLQIVLVTGQFMTEDEVAMISKKLGGKDIQFDVVLIGADVPELSQFAKDHKGRYVSLPEDQVAAWLEAAPKQAGPPAKKPDEGEKKDTKKEDENEEKKE